MHRTGRSYHLPTGGAVYFDTGVIEIATPMIEIERGCGARGTRSLWESLGFLRSELDALGGAHERDVRLVGFSTHYNVSFELPRRARRDGRTVEQLAYLLTHILAAPVMLLAANRRSTGIGVRPRGNRIEITADFTPDAALMVATATLIVGIVREVMTWPELRARASSSDTRHSRRARLRADAAQLAEGMGREVRLLSRESRSRADVNARDVDDARGRAALAARDGRPHHAPASGRSIRALGDPLSLRLIAAVMRGRAPSLLELDDRPAAYEDVGRLCTWDDLFPITLLPRSRYERVLSHAISGRRVRMDGSWHRPIGVRGWTHVVFRRESDGARRVRVARRACSRISTRGIAPRIVGASQRRVYRTARDIERSVASRTSAAPRWTRPSTCVVARATSPRLDAELPPRRSGSSAAAEKRVDVEREAPLPLSERTGVRPCRDVAVQSRERKCRPVKDRRRAVKRRGVNAEAPQPRARPGHDDELTRRVRAHVERCDSHGMHIELLAPAPRYACSPPVRGDHAGFRHPPRTETPTPRSTWRPRSPTCSTGSSTSASSARRARPTESWTLVDCGLARLRVEDQARRGRLFGEGLAAGGDRAHARTLRSHRRGAHARARVGRARVCARARAAVPHGTVVLSAARSARRRRRDERHVGALSSKRPIDLGRHVHELPADGSVPGAPGWRWIPTPGHSPGHVSLVRDSDRTVVAGDAFTTTKQESLVAALTQRAEIHGPPMYFTPDWDVARASVKHLAEYAPSAAITGHGPPLRGERLQDGLRQSLVALRRVGASRARALPRSPGHHRWLGRRRAAAAAGEHGAPSSWPVSHSVR